MPLTGTPNSLNSARSRAPRSEPVDPVPVPGGASIWAVGGGKGGIGKSFISANAATIAARSGMRVILIDCDLGGANLHTCLGVRGTPERTNLSDVLEDRVVDLDKIAVETPVPGLRLILGALGHTGTAQTNHEQCEHLLQGVRRLPADVIILDLAAGMDRATLDFFNGADKSLLVTTPEPTAIENAYSFLRAAFYRRLSYAMNGSPVRDVIRDAMSQREGLRTPDDLLAAIERVDPAETERFRSVIRGFRPRLVVNQVRTTDEVKMGFSIRAVCRRFFGVDLDYVGYINYDDFVWRSIKERRPLVTAYPQSDGALYIRQIVKKMLKD